MTKNSSGHEESCSTQTLDLRHPPTREQFGFASGANTATKSCDAGFTVHVDLPRDVKVEMQARRTTADSMRTADPETGQPTTLSISSTFADVSTTASRAADLAESLDMDPAEITSWRHAAAAAHGDTDNTTSPFIRSTLGYVTAELQVVRLGVSENSYISLTLSWGH